MSRARMALRDFARRCGTHQCLTLLVVFTAFFSGCLQGPIEEPEHVTPAHRPADYPAAVERLERLIAEIEAGSTREAGRIDVFAEWSDLIRWTPDMAGDSDLNEPAWNRVNEAARELEQIGRSWENLQGDSRQSAFRASVAAIREHWKTLDEVAREQAAVFRPTPEGKPKFEEKSAPEANPTREEKPTTDEKPAANSSATDTGEMP